MLPSITYCTYIQYKIIHLKILESHSCSRLPLGSRPVSWKARSESTLSRFRADAKPSKARCRRTLNNGGPPPAPPPEGPFVPSISLGLVLHEQSRNVGRFTTDNLEDFLCITCTTQYTVHPAVSKYIFFLTYFCDFFGFFLSF